MEKDTAEEAYYREQHLDNNTFSEGVDGERMGAWGSTERGIGNGDGGREIFIEGEEVRVVVVKIKDGRVADWKGAVRDWSLVESGGQENNATGASREPLVNGVRN